MTKLSKLGSAAKLVLLGSAAACVLTGLVVNSIKTDNRIVNEIAICEKNKKEEQVTIPVSDYEYYNNRYIRYCGMPNKKHFFLSPLSTSAINVYYPINTKQINFLNETYQVISVDPNQITSK